MGARVQANAVAVGLAAAGLAATALAVRPLGGVFFMFQFAAVVGAALYGGFAPGLFTMFLCGAGSLALWSGGELDTAEAHRLGAFVVVSVFFAWLAARMRRARAAAVEAKAKAEAAEAEARAVGAQQERLVAVVGHDLRNPLTAIVVSAELLQLPGGVPERRAVNLTRIETSARRMQTMIDDLLDFARARHGAGLPVQPRLLRLGEICRSALAELQAARPGCAVELEVGRDDVAPLDPARVEQLVSNLVTNALKYGSEAAPVRVEVAGDGADVRLAVTNEGLPIPPALLDTLFEPFRPGDTAESVGLGLFIVREIARAHGGDVSVRSGDGNTTFTVVFPKAPAGAAEVSAA